jgi:hypothetical protein
MGNALRVFSCAATANGAASGADWLKSEAKRLPLLLDAMGAEDFLEKDICKVQRAADLLVSAAQASIFRPYCKKPTTLKVYM